MLHFTPLPLFVLPGVQGVVQLLVQWNKAEFVHVDLQWISAPRRHSSEDELSVINGQTPLQGTQIPLVFDDTAFEHIELMWRGIVSAGNRAVMTAGG